MKVYFDPKKSVFSPSEIAVIEEVATTLYDSMPHLSRFGTCIIDHQLENPSGYNEAHLAACFDLPSGIFHYQSGPDHWVTSHRLAEESIDELLKWPSEQCLYRPTTRCQLIESGIYHYEGEHNVMVINCDRGRFLISCHVNYESKGFTVSYWDRQFDENKAFRLALLELLDEAVHHRDVHAGAFGDAVLSLGIEKLGIPALLFRHGENDGLHVL